MRAYYKEILDKANNQQADISLIKRLTELVLTQQAAEPLLAQLRRYELICKVQTEFKNRPDDIGAYQMIKQMADKYHRSTSTIEKFVYVENVLNDE